MSTPAGLFAIYNALRKIYPNQTNPLQVSALVKYWLNGPDPLDYITMYANAGDARLGIPPHWHYISCGLSDLYGDGRVHDVTGNDGISGFGFELTMRLKRDADEDSPPTWPAELMQCLAKYVFKTETSFCSGDHISWHQALDTKHNYIEHMLLTYDPQLPELSTPYGSLNFIQIVGICAEELFAAQHWNGFAIINLMKQIPAAGGHWLLTDMTRCESIFAFNPRLLELVEVGINEEGSDLSGVSANCWWSECSKLTIYREALQAHNSCNNAPSPNNSVLSVRIRSSSKSNLPNQEEQPSTDSLSRTSNYSCINGLFAAKSIQNGIQLRFNLEAAALFPLAIRGRLAHGRHFTFKSVVSDSAITFVTSDVIGSSVNDKSPFAAIQSWLQVLVTDDFLEILVKDLEELQRPHKLKLPRLYVWPEQNLMITVTDDGVNV
ncbi:suppressor of fused homolog isoform X1 [Hydra vulgaris]|uniref:suppressor of fused homolog isoform X1 n=1 Tax=Hydra vulgaris TaxID=6087 RepID=UPI000640E1F7|nr:suppressor of fused homolog [Hydra vulgaris]